MNTLRFTLTLILGFALPYAVQRWDRARLPAEQRAYAWSGARWAAALYGFGPFSMIAWCLVTRWPLMMRWWREGGSSRVKIVAPPLAGLLAVVVIALAVEGVDWLFAVITGTPR